MSRGFTKLLRAVTQEGAEVIVTSKGKPVAVLCPYEHHEKARRQQAIARLWAVTDQLLQGITLEETYASSRRDLEARDGG